MFLPCYPLVYLLNIYEILGLFGYFECVAGVFEVVKEGVADFGDLVVHEDGAEESGDLLERLAGEVEAVDEEEVVVGGQLDEGDALFGLLEFSETDDGLGVYAEHFGREEGGEFGGDVWGVVVDPDDVFSFETPCF